MGKRDFLAGTQKSTRQKKTAEKLKFIKMQASALQKIPLRKARHTKGLNPDYTRNSTRKEPSPLKILNRQKIQVDSSEKK